MHFLKNLQLGLFNELLLQNIPGKVKPFCSQQFSSSITWFKVNILKPELFEIKVRKFFFYIWWFLQKSTLQAKKAKSENLLPFFTFQKQPDIKY